ncbi:hypothetical protein AbraIFM66950_003051 [Aspergillus brasiliensis]|nr:hypothetical protein AbraIFM66950_003051 [Aspergillus brasiliensis]
MSPKQVAVQVIYPASAASSFNKEYYLNTHIPLAKSRWGPEGLLSWAVFAGGEGTGYSVQAVLIWKSLEAYNAQTEEEVVNDIKNFTNVLPYRWIGEIIDQGTIAAE